MERDTMMSGPQKKAFWMASRRACGARATAAFAIAVVAGLLAGCAQSGATGGRTASAIRDRDSETIKPAGYINPGPPWSQDYCREGPSPSAGAGVSVAEDGRCAAPLLG